MIHKISKHVLSLNIKHFLGLILLLHDIFTCALIKNLIFLLLHNYALDLFLIQKGNMGKKLSLPLLLVSLVSLSHFFFHIFIFLEQDFLMTMTSPLLIVNLDSFLTGSILYHYLSALGHISFSQGCSTFSKILSSSSLQP